MGENLGRTGTDSGRLIYLELTTSVGTETDVYLLPKLFYELNLFFMRVKIILKVNIKYLIKKDLFYRMYFSHFSNK